MYMHARVYICMYLCMHAWKVKIHAVDDVRNFDLCVHVSIYVCEEFLVRSCKVRVCTHMNYIACIRTQTQTDTYALRLRLTLIHKHSDSYVCTQTQTQATKFRTLPACRTNSYTNTHISSYTDSEMDSFKSEYDFSSPPVSRTPEIMKCM